MCVGPQKEGTNHTLATSDAALWRVSLSTWVMGQTDMDTRRNIAAENKAGKEREKNVDQMPLM